MYSSQPANNPFSRSPTMAWAVTAITLALYYILPWIRWDRGPGLPYQAFLLDFANQRLLFGPIEIWAQEFYYVTGALVLSAPALILAVLAAFDRPGRVAG